MAKKERAKTLVLAIKDSFSYVAIWQFAGFTILLLLVWVNEILDVAALLYGYPANPPSIVRGCIGSAGVMLAATVVIGNTYLQQRRIISGVLTICSYCHKIRIDQEVWHRIEDYLHKNPMLRLTHGMCPECFGQMKTQWEKEDRSKGKKGADAKA